MKLLVVGVARVDSILELIEPLSTHQIQPLISDERADPERVAAVYERIYNSLLDAAAH